MQSQKTKLLVFWLIITIIVAGIIYFWRIVAEEKSNAVKLTQNNLTMYSSEKYTFQYLQNYVTRRNFGLGPDTNPLKILAVEKEGGKLEIFQMKDFGDRPWGIEGEPAQEELDSYIPKEFLTIGNGDKKYDVWLYYSEKDSQTKNELHEIFNSIKVK